jgi:Spy/CpxP family protein refolding chaperone
MENNNIRRKAGMLVALVLFLGVAIGALGMHYWEARAYGHRVIVPTHSEIVQQLIEQLSLTPEQQSQVTAITEDVHSKLRALQDQVKPQADAIRRDGRQRIRAILTPEQQPKFDEFTQKLDELRAKAADQK